MHEIHNILTKNSAILFDSKMDQWPQQTEDHLSKPILSQCLFSYNPQFIDEHANDFLLIYKLYINTITNLQVNIAIA
jgi:hypothetical protein